MALRVRTAARHRWCSPAAARARPRHPPIAAACNPTASSARLASPILHQAIRGRLSDRQHVRSRQALRFEDSNGYLLTMCGDAVTDQVDGMPQRLRLAHGGRHAAARRRRRPRDVRRPRTAVPLPAAGPDACRPSTCNCGTADLTASNTSRSTATCRASGSPKATPSPRARPSGGPATPAAAERRTCTSACSRAATTLSPQIDPYGWHASTPDPWEADPRGAASVWLWKDGAAPRIR